MQNVTSNWAERYLCMICISPQIELIFASASQGLACRSQSHKGTGGLDHEGVRKQVEAQQQERSRTQEVVTKHPSST